MVLRDFFVATWTLVALISAVIADEFPVRIPRSFETEVFAERQSDEGFVPTQFLISEINFDDFANYRIRNFDATSIKADLVRDGLNMVCGETEAIVVGGQCLCLTRLSQKFRGSIPTNRLELESILDENCRNVQWDVAFATNDDMLQNMLWRFPVLGIIVGSQDLIGPGKTAFSIPKISGEVLNSNEAKFKTIVNNVTHRGVIQKWRGGWRVSSLESTFSKPAFTSQLSVQEHNSELVLDSTISKNEDNPASRAKARMRNIQLEGNFPIELTQTIANGTPVSLMDSPQIKAVWKDGKVVRVYEGGTVDDLGSATFRTGSSSFTILKLLIITLGFACAGGGLLWMRRVGANQK